MRIPYLCIALFPLLGSAQQFSVGLIGGVPAEPPVGKSADKMPLVVGPTLSIGVFRGLSFETGVLFHRLGTTHQDYAFPSQNGALVLGSDQWRARAIEIPLLFRYHFLSSTRTWRPFLSMGPAIRRTSIHYTALRSTLSGSPIEATPVSTDTVKWNVDPAVAAGVSFRAGRVHLEPQVRYSYWGAGKHEVVRQNQVQFLFGLRF